MANDTKNESSRPDQEKRVNEELDPKTKKTPESREVPRTNEKMDIPQRPGSQIIVGPEGPYSEDTFSTADSDAR